MNRAVLRGTLVAPPSGMIEHPRKPDIPRPPGSPDIIDEAPSDLNPAPPPDIPPQPLPDRPTPHPDLPGPT
jgi:hypothetical protein